jgi:hypothetical protein
MMKKLLLLKAAKEYGVQLSQADQEELGLSTSELKYNTDSHSSAPDSTAQ